MAGVDLGRVAYVPKGAYDALATYSRLDVVSYQGGSFVSLIDNNTGNTPVAGVNWALVAAKGDKGDKGDKGATGAQGVKGDTGPAGPKGDKGDTGPIGPQGVVGDTGAVGPQGPKGDTGAKGEKGDKGDTGATGATGPQGLKGDKGDQGIQGVQGVKGDKGDPGQNGVISVDAPADGKTYGRKNEGWTEVVMPDTEVPFIPFELVGLFISNEDTATITSDQISTAIGGVSGFNKLFDAVNNGLSLLMQIKQPIGVNAYVSTFVPCNIIGALSDYPTENQKTFSYEFTFENNVYDIGVILDNNTTFSMFGNERWLAVTGDGNKIVVMETTGAGNKCLADNGEYVYMIAPTTVTKATTLTNLSTANYSIMVTLSAASALSFDHSPAEGWECMIDIKNTSSSDIIQALPNASGWQCEDASMTIGAGKIASISVRYVHSTYVVIAKSN